MAWSTPYTSWSTSDGLLNTDMNRIEGNNLDNRTNLYNAMGNYVNGFRIFAFDGSYSTGAYEVYILGDNGECAAQNTTDFIHFTSFHRKLLSAADFTPGSGSTTPGKAPGATYATDKWFYLFVLKNPTTSAIDFCFDDVRAGTNITGSTIETTHGYTSHRRIGALKVTSLNATSGFVPTIGRNNRFWMSGGNAPRQTYYTFVDTSSHLWFLADSAGVEILPPSSLVCSSAYVRVKPSKVDELTMWNSTFTSTYVAGQGTMVTNNHSGLGAYEYKTNVTISPSDSYVYARSSTGSASPSVTWYMYVNYYDDEYLDL